jgi:hypothetical protein
MKTTGQTKSKSAFSSFYHADGDTEPEILFMHVNDHRRWRIAQTIERMGFNLCFWV